jgi:hypothetical protein
VLLEQVQLDGTTTNVTTRTALDPAHSYLLVFSGTGTRCLTFYSDSQGRRCGLTEGAPSTVDAFYCISPCVTAATPPAYRPFIQVRTPGEGFSPSGPDPPVPYNPAHEYAIETANGRLPGTDWLNVSQGPLTLNLSTWAPGLETGTFTVQLYELRADAQAPPATPAPVSPSAPATPSSPSAAPVPRTPLRGRPRVLRRRSFPDLASPSSFTGTPIRTGDVSAGVPARIRVASLRASRCLRVLVVSTIATGAVRARVSAFTGSAHRARVLGQRTFALRHGQANSTCLPIPAFARRLAPGSSIQVAIGSQRAGARRGRLVVRSIPVVT